MSRYNRSENTRRAKEWRRLAASILIDALGGECRVCGYKKCQRAFDFHHVDPASKLDSVAAFLALRTWTRLAAEARKCVLVCARCHREIHAGVTQCPEVLDYQIPDRLPINNGRRTQKKCPVSKEDLRYMYQRNGTKKLASQFGVNYRTMARWCDEAGCERRPNTWKNYVG